MSSKCSNWHPMWIFFLNLLSFGSCNFISTSHAANKERTFAKCSLGIFSKIYHHLWWGMVCWLIFFVMVGWIFHLLFFLVLDLVLFPSWASGAVGFKHLQWYPSWDSSPTPLMGKLVSVLTWLTDACMIDKKGLIALIEKEIKKIFFLLPHLFLFLHIFFVILLLLTLH